MEESQRKEIMVKWQEEWNEAGKVEWTRKLIKDIEKVKEGRRWTGGIR